MDEVRWGIIGSGRIAHRFAEDIKLVKNAKLIACSSKDATKAKDFATKFKLEFHYGNYEEMLNNTSIDAVYIATTHNFHYENAMLCIKYNKHILCEKSFTINAGQAEEIFSTARTKNLFVMEAMWARFLPASRWVKEQILRGEIGSINSIYAQFGIRFPYDPESRIFNINLAGGGLLDLGIYPLSFTCNFLGNDPISIKGVAKIGESGVDEQASISLLYKNGATATVNYSTLDDYENTGTIYGTRGKIIIDTAPVPVKAKLIKDNKQVTEFESTGTNGFEHEIREATELIINSELESPVLRAEDTIEILKICDELRAQWNFKYPEEYL